MRTFGILCTFRLADTTFGLPAGILLGCFILSGWMAFPMAGTGTPVFMGIPNEFTMEWMLSPETGLMMYPSSVFKGIVWGAGYKIGISSSALCLSLIQEAISKIIVMYVSAFFR